MKIKSIVLAATLVFLSACASDSDIGEEPERSSLNGRWVGSSQYGFDEEMKNHCEHVEYQIAHSSARLIIEEAWATCDGNKSAEWERTELELRNGAVYYRNYRVGSYIGNSIIIDYKTKDSTAKIVFSMQKGQLVVYQAYTSTDPEFLEDFQYYSRANMKHINDTNFGGFK